MANYKGHCIINIFLGLPLCLGGLFLWFEPDAYLTAAFSVTFVYSTLFMSPDLDLCYQLRIKSIRGFLSLPFRPYAHVFRHRGWSHSIFLGTPLRILWLFGCATLLFLVAYMIVPNKYMVSIPNKAELQALFIKYKPFIQYGAGGVVMADLCHYLVDYESSR